MTYACPSCGSPLSLLFGEISVNLALVEARAWCNFCHHSEYLGAHKPPPKEGPDHA